MFAVVWIATLFKISETLYQTTTVVLTTPKNSNRISLTPYGINASDRTFLVFRVRSCGPASVVLTNTDPIPVSEFVYGHQNNTRCAFKAGIYTRFSYPCSNACSEFDEYWVSWGDSDLDLTQDWTMGRGTIPQADVIGSNPYTYFVPKFISIYSDLYEAEWEFDVNSTSTTEQPILTEPVTAETTTTDHVTEIVTIESTETVTMEDISSTEAATSEPALTSPSSSSVSFILTEPATAETTTTDHVTEIVTIESTETVTMEDISSTEAATSEPALTSPSSSSVSFTTRSISKVNGSSYCYCTLNKTCETKNYTEEELNQMIENIVQELKVSVKDTNAYRRRLISAPDDRPSAQRMGEVGAVVIGLVILGIVLMDFPRVVKFFRGDHGRENEYKRKPSKRKKKSQNQSPLTQ